MTSTPHTAGKGGAIAPPDLTELLPIRCNVSDETLGENIRAAMKRKLPIVNFKRKHDGVALLVGGGPSLMGDIETIRTLQADGAKIFALNGAAKWLATKGIIADALILMDARPHNFRFVEECPKETVLYLATQCPPEVFNSAEGREVITWHAPTGGMSGVTETRKAAFICGGTSVGIRAIHLVCVLGYRTLHLFGYDSSYAGNEAHAYQQVENESDRLVECFVAGMRFVSTPWMIRQADDFRDVAYLLAKHGVDTHVHGGGLLPMIAHEMANHDGVLRVVYDLAKAPASWDFTTFLVMAEIEKRSRGYDKISVSIKAGPNDGFRADKLPTTIQAQRNMLEHVVKPAVTMIGGELSDHERGEEYAYTHAAICGLARRGCEIPRFKAPDWAKNFIQRKTGNRHPIVITLREAEYWPDRNSNIEAWARFAREHENVVIIRDTAYAHSDTGFEGLDICPEASLDINCRLALYEQAAINLSVSTGPCNLLVFSECPYLIFNIFPPGYLEAERWSAMTGLEMNSQWPWASHKQRLVWEPDDYEVISREFKDAILKIASPQIVCAAE